MIQAQTRGQVAQGVQQWGLAPGARKMIDAEEQAAQLAMQTGVYGVWRSAKGTDCTRIGPTARCFCGHSFAEHFFVSPKAPYPICKGCSCRGFQFIPSRPEEVGEWWLPRRKGFNVHTWRAKCRCGHGHDEHDPVTRRCRCGCSVFQSNFACLVCDLKWEDHETVFETATERLMAGRPVGDDFRPLADDAALRDMVFPGQHGAGAVDSFAPSSLRRAQVAPERGERSVRTMAASSGGAVRTTQLANRWGKVAPPGLEQDTHARQQLESASGQGGAGAEGSSYGLDGAEYGGGRDGRRGSSAAGARPGSAASSSRAPGGASSSGRSGAAGGSSILSVRGAAVSNVGNNAAAGVARGAGGAAGQRPVSASRTAVASRGGGGGGGWSGGAAGAGQGPGLSAAGGAGAGRPASAGRRSVPSAASPVAPVGGPAVRGSPAGQLRGSGGGAGGGGGARGFYGAPGESDKPLSSGFRPVYD